MNNRLRFILVAILFVGYVALLLMCSGPVDSAPVDPTPTAEYYDYLPMVLVGPSPTPTLVPTVRPTVTPEPTVRPTLPPTTQEFDPSTPISTQPWVTLFPPFPTYTPASTLTLPAP